MQIGFIGLGHMGGPMAINLVKAGHNVKFVGGTPADAVRHSLTMRQITLTQHPAFTLPTLNFAGSAAGIDARRVVDRGVLPVINTGIAHKQAGVGQIGAGITTAPLTCFVEALGALTQTLEA